jgi:hypothetical protein
MASQLPDQIEQAALRLVTLTEFEERSRSGGEQWNRKANDGRETVKAVKYEIHSPEECGVNLAVWVWERTGFEGQGTSSREEHPVNLSQVLAPDVRYCQIKTTPCVERKELLGSRQ